MSFLENLGKSISGVAQNAAKKSNEMIEITKINMAIGAEEDKIKDIQVAMGKKAYDSFVAGTAISMEDFKVECAEISGKYEAIKELKAKIFEVKDLKLCTSCGAEIEREVQFCNKCGAKQEIPEPSAETATPTGPACPKCGAGLAADAGFCSSCGEKTK